MKKILFFALVCCILVLALGCSSEPVEFSEKLSNNRNCYIDVLEIVPDSYDSDIFCKCILENGDEVWMQISSWEYQEYFDPDFDVSVNYARTVKFDKSVRLTGKVKKVTNKVAGKNKIKVLIMLSLIILLKEQEE